MELPEGLSGFSKRLRTARKENGLTQKALSEISFVGYRSIQRYECIDAGDGNDQEHKISTANLLRLAQALDVTPEWLLLGEENMDIYMNRLETDLKALTREEIKDYHTKPLTDKVLSHLKLTDDFITTILLYWKSNTMKCNLHRSYVEDTIIRYCHHRNKKKNEASSNEKKL